MHSENPTQEKSKNTSQHYIAYVQTYLMLNHQKHVTISYVYANLSKSWTNLINTVYFGLRPIILPKRGKKGTIEIIFSCSIVDTK